MLPPIISHALTVLSHSQFCLVFGAHYEWLLTFRCILASTYEMKEEDREFVPDIFSEPALRAAIEA